MKQNDALQRSMADVLLTTTTVRQMQSVGAGATPDRGVGGTPCVCLRASSVRQARLSSVVLFWFELLPHAGKHNFEHLVEVFHADLLANSARVWADGRS